MPARAKKNRKPEKKSEGSFRIIAGEYRSRRLSFPEVEGLRPTTDRVRETVFNWMRHEVIGAKVLDLFAGSGALGFEAASRGAKHVQFIEKNAQAFRYLEQNKALLNVPASVSHVDALSFLETYSGKPLDIVLIDPPFRKDLVNQVLELLDNRQVLAPDGLVYIETEAELSQLDIPSAWQELKSKKAGQVIYRLYEIKA